MSKKPAQTFDKVVVTIGLVALVVRVLVFLFCGI